MKAKKSLFVMLFSLVFSALLGVTASYAWFISLVSIKSQDLSGSVFQNYFHCGTGNEDDPFVITRPKHWENLVYLHNNIEGFYDAESYRHSMDEVVEQNKNYYTKDEDGNYVLVTSPSGNPSLEGYYDVTNGYFFEIGYDLPEDDTDEKRVYEYDGKVSTGDTSTVLNLSYLKPLIPLGKAGQPFVAQIKGNGITVSNFTVTGTGFSDIGIFGYVGDEKNRSGTLDGVFFDNFVIDATGCDSSAATSSAHDEYNNGVGVHDSNTCNIGYLAGHIANTGTFTDVYVNNCELKGCSGNNIGKNVYGYYGKADKDVEHGDEGKGFSYKFTFDSKAFYRYINGNWQTGDNIGNSYTRVRNTEYDSYYANNKDQNKRISGDALTRGNSLIAGRNYALGGTNPGNAQAARNFSTSTLGFYNGGSYYNTYEYSLEYALNESFSNREKMAENAALDDSYGPDRQPVGSEDGEPFYYYDTTTEQWKYYTSYNYVDEQTYNLTFTTTALPKESLSSLFGIGSFDDTNGNVAATMTMSVYLDDQPVATTSKNILVNITTSGWLFKTQTLSYSSIGTVSLTIPNVQRGRHNYCVLVSVVSTEAFGNNNVVYYRMANSTKNGNAVDQLLTKDIKSNDSISVTFTDIQKNTAFTCVQKPFTEYIVKNFVNNTEAPYVDGPYVIVGDDLGDDTDTWIAMTKKTAEFNVSSEDILVDEETIHNWRWTATVVDGPFDYEGTENYIGDQGYNENKDLIDPNSIVGSGYNSKNIDVIGGGVSFSQNYCTIVAENYNLTNMACRSVPNDKVYDGVSQTTKYKFYQTQYCANSVVMFVKNMNDADGTMGKITLNYSLAIGQYFNVTLKEPSFKKGYDADRVAAGNYTAENCFVDFNTFGDDYINNTDGDERSAEITIRRADIERASFCGLDVDGYIVAKYDDSGKLICGDPSLIDTYVLVVGVHKSSGQNNITINTRITSIDFYFKAEGYGGTFGTVDYRSAGQGPEVEKSILSYIFSTPTTDAGNGAIVSDSNFSIKVAYSEVSEEDGTYQGYYTITTALISGTNFNITFYLYDTTNYYMIINGNEIKGVGSYSTFIDPTT